MRWRCKNSLAKLLLLSSWAAACVGPKVRQPRRVNSSTTPSISGNSGPTMMRSGWRRLASATIESRLLTSTATHSASSAMPPFPGAQYIFVTRGDWRSFHTKACSRPPLPMTRIFMIEHLRLGARADDVKRDLKSDLKSMSVVLSQVSERILQVDLLFFRSIKKMGKADEPADTKARAGPGLQPTDAQGRSHVSLEGVHSSIEVPHHEAGFWEQWRAFVGPAILVSVGYMDPGNWGTDLQAGAQFKYGLLWVVGLASLMAIFMQVISARLGVVTGKDLAQCCRDWYPAWTRWPNWFFAELAVAACDLAEVLGSAVALNLMFHIPLFWAVIITGLDVLLLLALQR